MKIILCEPGKVAKEKEIDPGLSSLQKEVDGYIESLYPFDDNVAIICNEEGKINSMPLNRAIYDKDGKMIEIIAGPFFICGTTEYSFCSLSDEQLERYKDMFLLPELMFSQNGNIRSIKYVPSAL